MRQYEWFKRWRNEDRSDEQEEQTSGRRGSGAWGRIKEAKKPNDLSDGRGPRRDMRCRRGTASFEPDLYGEKGAG